MELFLTVCVSSATLGLLYTLFGTGIGLVLRASGEVNLAHGDTLTLATAVGVATSVGPGRGLLAVLLAVAVSAAIGTAAYLAVYGPVARRARPGVPGLGFLPALAVALLVRSAVERLLPRGSIAVEPLFPASPVRLFGDFRLPAAGWWVLAAGLLVPLGLAALLRHTRTGARLRAVSDDPVLARVTGIPVTRTLAVCFALAGATGGLAGALFGAYFGQVAVLLGWQATVKGFVVAVLGGVGSVWGVVVAGLALGTLESAVSAYVTTTYRDAVGLVVLVVVLLALPRGLLAREQLRTL